jgi:Ser/Thr protein kinase RdoA (MazF antagonist)
VARGEQGEVWRLETENGAWAVKRHFEPPDPVDTERAARHQEAARAAGVHVPAVVRTTTGDVLANVAGEPVRVFGWLDLAGRDPMVDPVAVGSVVAAIHRVRHDAGIPVHPWYRDPVGAGAWDDLVAALSTAGAPFGDELAAYRRELVALEGLLEAPSRLQTCHRDLWADNVLGTDDGLCVIDWDTCGLADPSQELAMVLFEFGMGDEVRIRAIRDAYVDAGGPGRVERPGAFSMAIASLGHIGYRHGRMWLDLSGERDHSAAGMEEFLGERRLTVGVVNSILDVVTAG